MHKTQQLMAIKLVLKIEKPNSSFLQRVSVNMTLQIFLR